MGKGLLIIAMSLVIVGAIMVLNGQGASMDTREEVSAYEHKVIARDAAESGFSQGLSAIQRELMDADPAINGSMGGATYNVTLGTAVYGDFDVTSVGRAAEEEHEIMGNVIFEVPVDAATLLSSDDVTLLFTDDDASINGIDHRSPTISGGDSHPGYLSPVYAVRTNSGQDAALKSQLAATASDDRVVGLGGENSVSGGFDAGFYGELYTEALTLSAMPYYTEYAGPTSVSLDSDIGSPGDPQIVVVHGDATISGNGTGYGLLLVSDGNLTFDSETARWEGLVLARNAGGLTIDMTDGGSVYGGLAAFDYAGGAGIEECTPDFDIVGDETIVNEAFRVRIEVLGAAISMGAGGYDMPVTAQLKIGDSTIEPWGDFDLALDGNVNRAGSFIYEPDIIYPPGSIKINARSWKMDGSYTYEWKRTSDGWERVRVWSGGDGTSNDDWEIHMEKDSDAIDQQLEVLGDGSDVPDVSGFDGQTSAAEFVSGYIEDGKIKLDQNQSIYLFELGVNNTSSAAHDYQDLVVIVTMVPASVASCATDVSATPRLDLTLGEDARLQYSAEAIAKLGMRLDVIRNRTRVVVADQRSSVK